MLGIWNLNGGQLTLAPTGNSVLQRRGSRQASVKTYHKIIRRTGCCRTPLHQTGVPCGGGVAALRSTKLQIANTK